MLKIIVWFRNDLRLSDNPALLAASQQGEVIPLFIWAPEEEGDWPLGVMSRAWLKQSLAALNHSLKGKLVIRQGSSLSTLKAVIQESGASGLFFNRRYEPASISRDQAVVDALQGKVKVDTFNGSLLVEPWDVETKEGKPYQVFTPYWRTCLKLAPFQADGKVTPVCADPLPPRLDLDALSLPDHPLKGWEVGEAGAKKRLAHFLERGLAHYDTLRDRPDLDGVSRLSPHLHFGEITPRQIWQQIDPEGGFARQLIWREFAHHLLYHFPHTPLKPLKAPFAQFPWRDDPKGLKAWQEGRTGYPIVDAGMRQLAETGWMHNRVRLIVASFLVKDLLIPWQEGARWFWDKLVDADLANNTLGWQWTAGCGADAAPYFRIFNPATQSERFDPEGDYIRRYVPELRHLPAPLIHQPPLTPGYPEPIVDHKMARERALTALKEMAHHEDRYSRK